jgi:hypothetical protein
MKLRIEICAASKRHIELGFNRPSSRVGRSSPSHRDPTAASGSSLLMALGPIVHIVRKLRGSVLGRVFPPQRLHPRAFFKKSSRSVESDARILPGARVSRGFRLRLCLAGLRTESRLNRFRANAVSVPEPTDVSVHNRTMSEEHTGSQFSGSPGTKSRGVPVSTDVQLCNSFTNFE